MLRQWIIFYCVIVQCIVYCTIMTNTFTTLLLKSSLTLSGHSKYPIILKYELKLQTDPSKNELNGCIKHNSLSIPINDDFFVITLRNQGITQFKNFTSNFKHLHIGSGNQILVVLTFGKNQLNLWNDFTLSYTNFEPTIKYSNGTDANIPECYYLKDSTTFCVNHSNSVLNCSDENYYSSTVSPPLTGQTSVTLETHKPSMITVPNTVSTSVITTSVITSSSPTSNLPTTKTTNHIISTTNSQTHSTTLLPPNPIIINCTDPTTALNDIYCDLSTDEIIPTSGNISTITNATLHAINATKMSPEEIYAVAYILEQCSLIPNLTQTDFIGMAKLFDTIMLAPEESYENANDYSNSANSLILTINRMMTNSPSDVKYLNGSNIALLGKSLNCDNNNFDAGGITDLGNNFIEKSTNEKFDASIFINGETVCEVKATRVFYTIYRNSKFFVGDNDRGNGIISAYRINKNALKPYSKFSAATTSKEVVDLPQSCKNGLLQTDGRVVSATILKGTQKGYENIHRFEVNNEAKIMVIIKYSEEHIGTPLHGKLKISWWDHSSNQWSPQTCSVKTESHYYISECSHLTDFTLLVDGTSLDPLICNTALQTVNYFFVIGSIIGLSILCLIYLTMIIPGASNLKISRSLFKIIPICDISCISMVYTFILLLFYFNFTVFTNQKNTTGYNGCVAVAIISYWLLMSRLRCIMLSLFNSWRIIKEHLKGTTMDKFFGRITIAKVIYPVTFLSSTLLALIFGFTTSGKFFYRNDSLCWVRPDYKLAIIIPFTILGLSAIICVSIMTIRRFTILEKYFTINRVKTINRPNSPNVKTRLFVLFLTQFNLGAPWLLQYFTIFSPNATIWHFLFVIFNGSQGIVIFIAFIYRCYMESKLRKVKENTIKEWKNSRNINNNNNNLQIPKIIKESDGNERHETINVDENCIQIISRAPSQVVDDKPEISIRHANSNRNPTDVQRSVVVVQGQNDGENGTQYVNDDEAILQPNKLRIGHKNEDNSEGYLADTSQQKGNSSFDNPKTTTILPNFNPHKKSNDLLKFDYVIDRVGSRVMRVYKDSDLYNDSPPST